MRIIGRTLITKGIAGWRKAWSIATRGILDRYDGQEPRIVVQNLKYSFDLLGKKSFRVHYEFDIIGSKELELVSQYALSAMKAKNIDFEKELVGQKLAEYVIQRRVRGFCDVPIVSIYALNGKKLKDMDYSAEIQGLKQKLIKLELELSSQKAFQSMTECDIVGGKELEFATSQKIKGKRDLTPIFLALDD